MKNFNEIVCNVITKTCKVFKPDGCTMAPDFDFRSCCDEHDWHYSEQAITRLEADKRLRDCITKAGHPTKAQIYFAAVRAVGWAWWYKHHQENKRLKSNDN